MLQDGRDVERRSFADLAWKQIRGSLCCVVQIIRDKDADGFYVGELGGRRGLVPSNMVSPVDDSTAAGSTARSTTGVNHVAGSRLADGGDPLRAGKAVSPPSPRRHHRQNRWVTIISRSNITAIQLQLITITSKFCIAPPTKWTGALNKESCA